MQLNLKYPPTPENASRFAADIVEAALEINRVTLDFRPISLSEVDEILEGMRREGVTEEQVGETLFGFGCYVGEVVVRNAGARWRRAADTKMASLTSMPVVELPNGTVCNPIGKAFKRLKNGAPDSLLHFYRVFTLPPESK